MATVIPNWKRVAASVRVYPPDAIRQGIWDVMSSELKARYPRGQELETLYRIFRESIREVNSDKVAWLRILQEQDKLGEELARYLRTLVEESKKLADAEAPQGSNDVPYKCDPSEPRSWLKGLPIKHIPIQVQSATFTGVPGPSIPIRQL